MYPHEVKRSHDNQTALKNVSESIKYKYYNGID